MTSKDWPLLEFACRQEEKQCLRPVGRHVETAGSLGESHPPGDADLDRGASVRRSELCKVLGQPRMGPGPRRASRMEAPSTAILGLTTTIMTRHRMCQESSLPHP